MTPPPGGADGTGKTPATPMMMSMPPADGAIAAPKDASGATSSDAAPVVSAPGCDGYRFCDDFEAFTAGARPPTTSWSVSPYGSGGTLIIDDARSFSGSKSVKITTKGGEASAGVMMAPRNKSFLPLPENNLFGRMMVYLTATPPGPGICHWNNVEASGPLGMTGSATYRMGGMRQKFINNYVPYDCANFSKVA